MCHPEPTPDFRRTPQNPCVGIVRRNTRIVVRNALLEFDFDQSPPDKYNDPVIYNILLPCIYKTFDVSTKLHYQSSSGGSNPAIVSSSSLLLSSILALAKRSSISFLFFSSSDMTFFAGTNFFLAVVSAFGARETFYEMRQ